MSGRRWTPDEDATLAALWPDHPSERWDGWAWALPGRGAEAIRTRKRAVLGSGVDTPEASCVRSMAHGMAPSAIDAAQGWLPGTARGIMVERWRREKEGRP